MLISSRDVTGGDNFNEEKTHYVLEIKLNIRSKNKPNKK